MGNEEFQRLLRLPASELRERLPGNGRVSRDVVKLISELDDAEIYAAVRDLGGHDLHNLLAALAQADAARTSASPATGVPVGRGRSDPGRSGRSRQPKRPRSRAHQRPRTPRRPGRRQ